MQVEAIIYQTGFNRMVDMVHSYITISVVIPTMNQTVTLEDSGSMKDLSEKYDFHYTENECDLTPLYKRECVIDYNPETGNSKFLFY